MVVHSRYRQIANRGEYRKLYKYLGVLAAKEWRTSFEGIEALLGFQLPEKARVDNDWWANQPGSPGQLHAYAWNAAGWEISEVDLKSETVLLQRRTEDVLSSFSLDDVWPPISVGPWPEGLSLRREDMYEDRI